MPDIFLSYNREDQPRARLFAEAFAADGHDVWWDVGLRTGEAYDQVTETALRTAKAVVVLWSRRSVESRWVRAEATVADRRRTLVPCMIEPCERPIMFELTQTAELSHWHGESGDSVWQAFLADVRRFIAGGEAGQPPLPIMLPTPPSARRDPRPSIAILPFTNRSSESADEAFATGMAEDIATALSLVGGLRVIAQGATLAYRSNLSDLRSIGRELAAQYMLEGNVRRVDANLRVTAQLVEAETGAILWTQRFDRSLAELATLQEGLVEEVASHLGIEIQQTEMDRALQKPGDITAWEAVMRSYSAYAKMTPESTVFAVAEARRAVSLAPDYAFAQSALATGLSTFYVLTGDRRLIEEAVDLAESALASHAANPMQLSQCSTVLAIARRWDEALAAAERAVALNSSLFQARQALAISLNHFERYEETLVQCDEAERLAPRAFQQIYTYHRRYTAQFGLGRFDAALVSANVAIRMAPAERSAQAARIVILHGLGRADEAQEGMRRLRLLAADQPLAYWTDFMSRWFMPPSIAAIFLRDFASVWAAAGD